MMEAPGDQEPRVDIAGYLMAWLVEFVIEVITHQEECLSTITNTSSEVRNEVY